MRLSPHLVLLLATSFASTSILTPPVLPLIVRNPYLSTWLGNARQEPWQQWPMFWTGSEVGFGVLAFLPSTKQVIPLLGRPHESFQGAEEGFTVGFAEYNGATYDASVTNLTYSISPLEQRKHTENLDVTLSFLSPITPTSTLRQSLPAAYLTVYVDGNVDVSIYVEVNGDWVSGEKHSVIEWNLTEQEETNDAKGLKTWSVKRHTEELFTETFDQPEWGQLHFTGPADVRHESGAQSELRGRFARTGTLQNQNDGDFGEIGKGQKVFAFSTSFNLSATYTASPKATSSESVLFTITHVQDPVVQYAAARGLTYMRPLWRSWFETDDKLIQFHYGDFDNVAVLARSYSDQLTVDAYESGSTSYADIVALSARQAMGATSFSGTPENPLLFLKEISSNGNSQTVDVIFPAFPFFLYTNPRWAAYLLEPLLEHQLSGQYPNKYSMHDLGTHFPNLTGHADGKDEYMPVEECGDMLIMGLALVNAMSHVSEDQAQFIWSANRDSNMHNSETDENAAALTKFRTVESIQYIDSAWSGGTKGVKQAKRWLDGTYDLWKQWTGYLVEDALWPHNQLCTDDFAGWLALQTNLALKGIIGIKAFSEIAQFLDRKGDAEHYRNISDTYIKKWEEYAISKDGGHAKLAYDWYGSWTTLYSLYSDALLCFHPTVTASSSALETQEKVFAAGYDHSQTPIGPEQNPASTHNRSDFIPHHIYTNQSLFYSYVIQKYGLPLDSRHLYTKSDWQFYAAAVASPSVRKDILDRVAKWINETASDRAFTDLYETEGDGGFPAGIRFHARPVVGGHFSFLALERACGRGREQSIDV